MPTTYQDTEIAHPKLIVTPAYAGEHAAETDNWMTPLRPLDDVNVCSFATLNHHGHIPEILVDQ